MSAVIPEKGVCRIDFESTDKDDDYCLDVDAESEIDQSEISSCEEDKIQKNIHTNYNWTKFNKRKQDRVVKRIEYSSESESEDAQKRNKLSTTDHTDELEQRPHFENVPDLSNLLEAEISKLFKNDNNTIRKSFSHQYQNGPAEDVEIRVPDIQHNSTDVDSRSCMEMTDPVRRLTEVLVLPINHSKIKENYITHQQEFGVVESENFMDTISLQNKSGDDFQPNANFEINKSTLDNCSQQDTQNKEYNIVEFHQEPDDAMDFNMAVEALNLLKSKGRQFSNDSDSSEQQLHNIDAPSGNISKKLKVTNESSLPDSIIKARSINNEPFLYCCNVEKNGNLIFDSTLEITDCATGAIIPIESFYQSNKNLLTTDENEFSTLNKSQTEIQTDKNILPSTVIQLPDTVTCMKVPLHDSVLSCDRRDQESIMKEKDFRYSAQQQVEDVQTKTFHNDSSLKISKGYASLLPVLPVRKENVLKATSSTQQSRQKSKSYVEDEPEVPQITEISNAKIFSKNKTKDYTNSCINSSSKLKTKNINLEPKVKVKKFFIKLKDMDKSKDMDKGIEKRRRSTQTSKTSGCSVKHSLEPSSTLTNVDSINEASIVLENDSKSPKRKKSTRKSKKQKLEADLSNSTELTETLSESPAKPTFHQEAEVENEIGNMEKLKKHVAASKSKLSEEKESTEKKQQDIDLNNLKTPLDAFSITINDSMIKRIVDHTNEKLLGASKKVTIWGYKKATNELELRAFIGILLISAALKQTKNKLAELWSECFGASIYKATLQQGRFRILLHNLRFANGISTDETSKKDVFQIGDPWEEYLENCKKYPMPRVSLKAQNKLEDEDSKQDYTTLRKTTNLSLSVLFSMLDSAVIRGYTFFQKANPESEMCLRTFLKQIGMALVKPELKEKLMRQNTANSMRELIRRILNKKYRPSESFFLPEADQTLKKQKRCQLCSWNKDRKTRHQCICCQRNMCKEHRAQLCVQCMDSI